MHGLITILHFTELYPVLKMALSALSITPSILVYLKANSDCLERIQPCQNFCMYLLTCITTIVLYNNS